VVAYDQITAFFDTRLRLTIDAIADTMRQGLSSEDCFILATRAIHGFTQESSTLAALAALLVIRAAERQAADV